MVDTAVRGVCCHSLWKRASLYASREKTTCDSRLDTKTSYQPVTTPAEGETPKTRLLQRRGTRLACSRHGAGGRRNAGSELHWLKLGQDISECEQGGVFFLFLHACTPNVNAPGDDCVPEHGSGILDPRLQNSSASADPVWRAGRFMGGFSKWITLYVRMSSANAVRHSVVLEATAVSLSASNSKKMSSASQRRCARTVLQDVMTTSCALTSCN